MSKIKDETWKLDEIKIEFKRGYDFEKNHEHKKDRYEGANGWRYGLVKPDHYRSLWNTNLQRALLTMTACYGLAFNTKFLWKIFQEEISWINVLLLN